LNGVHYDANLKRVYMTGGRWYGTPDASPGWVYVYQQKDPDHYDVISKIKTRPGSGTSYRNSIVFMSRLRRSAIKKPKSWYLNPCQRSFDSRSPPRSHGLSRTTERLPPLMPSWAELES
jgi:hypothetical protein